MVIKMSNRIMDSLETLYNMISEAWGVPLGAERCVIERDKALELLDEIKAQFPIEIEEARRLLDKRNDFIENTKREAATIRRAAEERSRQLINEQEIVRIARAKSNEMLTKANESSTELRRVANEYVDDMMKHVEEALSASLGELRQTRSRFRDAARAAPPVQQAIASPQEQYADEIDDIVDDYDDDYDE
jgi:ATP-dependent Clp protease ATP-binding subunit ClpA